MKSAMKSGTLTPIILPNLYGSLVNGILLYLYPTLYVADSIKVALGIGNCAVGIYCLYCHSSKSWHSSVA